MHRIQEKLLRLSSSHNLGGISLRAIAEKIGENHPQKIKHHLEQLVKKGLIKYNESKSTIKKIPDSNSSLVSIPVLGSADCGPATIFAENNIEGYLKISNKLLKYKQGLFALKALGFSMNKADIKGKNIDDGDYVIIDSKIKNPENKDYVVSIIDNVCNIKKYLEDKTNKQIVLLSESTQYYPPIHIHPNETNYLVSGKVIDVVKKPHID